MRWTFFFIAAAALTGCRTPSERTEPDKTPVRADVFAGGRYTASASVGKEDTYEIFLHNPSNTPMTFVRAVLDGRELPLIDPKAHTALQKFSFGFKGRGVQPSARNLRDSAVRWCQFYPSETLPPGGYGSFQLNFRGESVSRRVDLRTACGRCFTVKIPRRAACSPLITFAAVQAGGRTIQLRCSGRVRPSSAEINGVAVPFRVLSAGRNGTPAVVLLSPVNPLRKGECVFVKVAFTDGGSDRILFRALPGVFSEAPYGGRDHTPLPEDERHRYGFDEEISVFRLPHDVACNDARAKEKGRTAAACLASRRFHFRRNPDALSGVDFCTALYPEIWSIYAPMADAVYAKPYRLHWGERPARFIEEEERQIADAVRLSAPRPVVWIPERFRAARELDGSEYEQLAWSAFLSGARVLRCHHWKNDVHDPFAGNPSLAAAVVSFNAAFNRLRPCLDRLVPVGGWTDRDRRLRVLEGWCGEDGVLLLVRSLAYSNGLSGSNVRLCAPGVGKRDVPLFFRSPEWLRAGIARDALSGEALASETTPLGLTIFLEGLEAFRLVWIANAGEGKRRMK